MTKTNWRKTVAYLLAGLAGLVLAALPARARPQQDSSQQTTGDAVADAARKARADKKKEAAKPKRVYTDDDMNHPAPQPDTPAGTAAQGATQATDKAPKGQADAASTSETLKDQETKWRKQFQDAYAKLARLEKELDILQREGDKAQTQYYSDPQKALTEQYTRKEINDKDTKIAAKQQEIAQMKQQISDMQDQLRKAGGDPGWGTP